MYGHGRVLPAIKTVLDECLLTVIAPEAITTSIPHAVSLESVILNTPTTTSSDSFAVVKNISSMASLAIWLTPVNPESDLAKRMHTAKLFGEIINVVFYIYLNVLLFLQTSRLTMFLAKVPVFGS